MNLPKRCVDLTEDHIDEALESVQSMRTLLEHMAHIAKPNEGAAKILVAISRIATTACEWLEGTLHVEVDELKGTSEIKVMTDLGGGFRELMFPRILVGVEYEELVRAVKTAPRLITPLKYRVRGGRMTLKRDLPGTVAPPPFEIAEECLRRSLPPKLRRSLPPIQPSGARAEKEEPTVEGAILGRLLPKTQRAVVIDDLAKLDVGWDFGAYSSTVNSRETKPPPPPKTPSKLPTRPPPTPDGEPEPAARPKPAAKQAPAVPAKPPGAPRARPAIRKVGDGPPKGKPKPR